MTAQIVFLCLGNICRSPLAEALARGKFGRLNLCFSSVGLEAGHGLDTSDFSIAYANEHGCSLVGHQPKGVSSAVLDQATWLIAMTRSQGAIVRSRYGEQLQGRLGILGAPGFDLQEHQHSPEVEDVDDPYGWPQDQYFACGDQISRLLDQWSTVFAELVGASDEVPTDANEPKRHQEKLK